MAALSACVTGFIAAMRAPWILAGCYLLTLVVVAPLGVALQRELPPPPPPSAADAAAPQRPNIDWLDEVAMRSTGPAASLSPAIVGVAGAIDPVDRFLDGRLPEWPVAAAVAAFLLAWSAMWGGIIVRLDANRRVGWRNCWTASHRAAGGVLVLAVVGILGYVALSLSLRPVLFGPVYQLLTRGSLDSTAVLCRVGLTMVYGASLMVWGQVLDYARIEAVLDARRPADAIRAALRFAAQRPWAVMAVATTFGFVFALLVGAYGAVEFVPGGSVPRLSRLILIGQAMIVVRLSLRLGLAGAQIRLRRHSLG